MYMQEALELVCRKRKLDPKDYALLLGNMSLLIPLDRTVASLEGKRELVIVKRTMLPQLGIDVVRGTGRTTDPNGEIHRQVTQLNLWDPQPPSSREYLMCQKQNTRHWISLQPTRYILLSLFPLCCTHCHAPQKYTVYRKMPMLSRQERTFAIDGVYVHVLSPSPGQSLSFSRKSK